MTLSISHYLNNMAKLTNQWDADNYREPGRQRIYLKDIDCPTVWYEKLKEQIPPCVFYLNESCGVIGSPGSNDELNMSEASHRKSRGIARAGDLMSCLPPTMRAENLMCYIGHEGTYTPAHREMCASLGQNIMVEASGTVDEDGKQTRPGSSIWFMTESKDRRLVSEYWLSTLGHDIEVENHFAQINAWKAAPFKTYIVEQKIGDFILIPPLAPHQVWNRGTRTMKVAWNRTTVETLRLALDEALPRARMVCRDEQYKNKAMIMFALEKYSDMLNEVNMQRQTSANQRLRLELTYSHQIRQLQKDFKRLFSFYTEILLSETLALVSPTEKRGQYLPFDSYVTCSYCRCNIFNRFLTCTSCIIKLENGEEDTYDICLECYAMGRSCRCISKYKWVEQFPWQELLQKHDFWRHQIIAFEGKVTEKSPKSFETAKKSMRIKSLAQVCQEQLKVRPWVNPNKEEVYKDQEDIESSEEIHVNGEGSVQKKRKKRPSERVLRETVSCHVSQKREMRWKVAICQCGRAYTYGCLFRAFDLMPLEVMENPDWRCPYCLKICSCATCRKSPDMKPFEPKETILGHDTKKIADPRSVESLVDFSHSNIGWIKKAGDDHPHETKRLRRRRDEADQDKSKDPNLEDHYATDDEYTPVEGQDPDNGIIYNMDVNVPIDPMLREEEPSVSLHDSVSNDKPMADVSSARETNRSTKRPKTTVKSAVIDKSKKGDRKKIEPSSLKSRPTPLAAPEAVMVSESPRIEHCATHSADLTSRYPDPTLPDATLSPLTAHPVQGTETGLSKKKQKRLSEIRSTVNGDLVSASKNDANEQYHKAKLQRTLAEAKRRDCFISAEAALSGKSLRIILPVDGSKMAALIGINGAEPSSHLRSMENGAEREASGTILIQSDAPAPVHLNSLASRPNGPKKRKIRVEQDDDFYTSKKQRHKAIKESISSLMDLHKMPVNYQEISDVSDGEEIPNQEQVARPKHRKPRTLPAYLARRDDDIQHESISRSLPHRSPDLPKDLSHTSHQKNQTANSSTRPKKATSSTAISKQPVDSFPAVALPKASPTVDLSMLGAGETAVREVRAARQAEENRKAKLRAIGWADSDDDYDSDSG